MPDLDKAQRDRIIKAAKALLVARENHPDNTLADLYDPHSLHTDVEVAHKSLDMAVDRAFTERGRPATTSDRMKILFPAYKAMLDEGKL